MKGLIFLIMLLIGLSLNTTATITIYGRNEGSTQTTTTSGGTTTTTLSIDCVNSSSDICYTVSTMQTGNVQNGEQTCLTIYSNSNIENYSGKLVDFDISNDYGISTFTFQDLRK
jgi:hypothetical protein